MSTGRATMLLIAVAVPIRTAAPAGQAGVPAPQASGGPPSGNLVDPDHPYLMLLETPPN